MVDLFVEMDGKSKQLRPGDVLGIEILPGVLMRCYRGVP